MTTADIRRDHATGTGGGGGGSGSGWRQGWMIFAAIMLVFGGVMAILQGIAAIAKDDIIVVSRNYAYTFDLTAWGWLHLALGLLAVFAGLALFQGAVWARVIAVFAAGGSLIVNFMWLPHYPLWALTLIAIDVFVIWAVCTAGSRRAVR